MKKWFIGGAVVFFALNMVSCGKKEASPEKKEVAKVFVFRPPAKKQDHYFSEGTPSRAIQDLDDHLDSYVLNAKTPEEKQYNLDLKRALVHGTFDMHELCRLALDKHWKEIGPAQQDSFVDLMTRLLEKKAVFSKEQGQKTQGPSKSLYSIVYEGDVYLGSDKTLALSKSTVHIPSESLKIEIQYKLKKMAEGWRIYDVVVDGASLLNNYKYQFDKIIAKEGYPTLVHRMESKLKDLDAGETNPKEAS